VIIDLRQANDVYKKNLTYFL